MCIYNMVDKQLWIIFAYLITWVLYMNIFPQTEQLCWDTSLPVDLADLLLRNKMFLLFLTTR